MARIYRINSKTISSLEKLITLDSEYQNVQFNSSDALTLAIEYLFLEGYKIWENFLEAIFLSYSRYNDPISGKRPFPYLAPKTESHALDLLKLEKNYLDWTSPDNVVKRAEICFRSHSIITTPIKASMQDLRDAKKLRNHIAHSSEESERIFQNISRNRIGQKVKRPGVFLNKISPDSINNYNVYFLELFKTLVNSLSV